MDKQSIRKFSSLLKKSPRIKAEKMNEALALVKENSDSYARALRLLGDIKLDETKPVAFDGFIYEPCRSIVAVGEDGKLYGNEMVSVVFLFGLRQLFIYEKRVCLTGSYEKERLSDFDYNDIAGLEIEREILPYERQKKVKKKQKNQPKTVETVVQNVGVVVPVTKLTVRSVAGEKVVPLPGDADTEEFMRTLRAAVRVKKSEL